MSRFPEQIYSYTMKYKAYNIISKILVPHDGTEMSDKALGRAVVLAKAFNAQLILLNVIEQIPVSPSIGKRPCSSGLG